MSGLSTNDAWRKAGGSAAEMVLLLNRKTYADRPWWDYFNVIRWRISNDDLWWLLRNAYLKGVLAEKEAQKARKS